MNGFLQDGSGDKSSTRLLMVVAVLGILFVWGYTSIKSGAPQSLPMEIVGLVVAVITGKVGTDAIQLNGVSFLKKTEQPAGQGQ